MTEQQANQTLQAYLSALFDTNKAAALQVVEQALSNGMAPESVVFDIIIPGMEKMVGGMIDDKAVTLSQHFLASKIAEEVADRLIPQFKVAPVSRGKVVIGTSYGDFHGLGKKIVIGCLRARMFEVFDLGLSVAPEVFVDRAVSLGANVIGISSMMVHTATGERGARRVREILRSRNLERGIRLIVGGAPYRFHEGLYLEVGADAWAATAAEAPIAIASLIQEARA